MPKGFQIIVPDDWKLSEDQITDATLSITRKEASKEYGKYAKRLAEVLRANFNIPKGHWQAYWTVATRVFGLAYGGHTEEVCIQLGRALARELGLSDADGERIARVVYRNTDYILGKKAEMEAIATTRGRR